MSDPRIPKKATKTDFIIGPWSFRYGTWNQNRSSWTVYPKGERSHWAMKATIYAASDEKTFVVTMYNHPYDARPTFSEAVELVLSWLPAVKEPSHEHA
ncbi:hypothetical protein [Mesorhizobium sp. CN2-181]|uniref:hypothetical protein n=1 Tax=Mesorhizobium yinganensis TaxID=3157707 RepID=UPI0032B827B4